MILHASSMSFCLGQDFVRINISGTQFDQSNVSVGDNEEFKLNLVTLSPLAVCDELQDMANLSY